MIVTRFAPSPTGRLHLGHAFAARFAYDKAKENGGKFLLRIEDIDPVRCKPEFVDGIFEDLDWLGLKWDEKPVFQSERLDFYADALQKLKDKGVLYPCVCTRKEIESEIARMGHAPHAGETAVYPGTCRGKSLDLSRYGRWSWRLDIAQSLKLTGDGLYFTDESRGTVKANPSVFGDVVLARKETPASYHLCSVADDAAQGVTLVTRGEDLFDSTHVHRLLQALLGLPTPRYCHHRLVLDAEGRRLAKRDGSVSIKFLREKGLKPAEIFELIKKVINFEKKILTEGE